MLAGPMTKHEPSDASEITFGFDELFFSRTDPAGVIQFGNSVFQRVSIYSWDELLLKPHKIIRHADTPHSTCCGTRSSRASRSAPM